MKKEKHKLTREEKKMLKQQEKENKRQAKAEKKKKDVYVPLRGIMGNAVDYNVYSMNAAERLTAFLIGFAGGFAVIYVFFRVLMFSVVVGAAAGILFQKPYERHLIKKRKRTLLLQFKDMLEALSASYSAGLNTKMAFEDSCQDLMNIYGPKADIVKEIQTITTGLKNNLIIEELLFDFAKRSGLEDVESFASVFSVSNRQGANIRRVVAESRDMISSKIEIEMDIETMISGNKNQLNIMLVMPLVIMLSLSSMGTMSAVSNTPVNIMTKIIVLIIIGAAYYMGRKIIDIKI